MIIIIQQMLTFTDCMTSFLGSVKKDYPVYIADHRISNKDPGQCYRTGETTMSYHMPTWTQSHLSNVLKLPK